MYCHLITTTDGQELIKDINLCMISHTFIYV